jgi:lipopolysaccharide biosynthesis regulator YciM
MRFHHVWKFNLLHLAAVASVLACLHPLPVHGQFDPFSQKRNELLGSLRGNVVMSNGTQKPPNVRIELRNTMGLAVSSAETDSSGFFEIRNLERGSYDVIATVGTAETSARVDIFSLDTPITIRIGAGSSAVHEPAAVSVNALRAHCRATKTFEAADRLLQKRDIRGAWNQVNKTLEACPNYAPALTLRGVLKMYGNQLEEALGDFNAALQIDCSYGLAYIGLASDYNHMQRFDEALRVLDRASSRTAPSWQAHLEASKALLGKRSFDAALRHATQAANMLGHDYAMFNFVKAQAFLGLNDKISAANELRRYLQQDSNSEQADKARTILAELDK